MWQKIKFFEFLLELAQINSSYSSISCLLLLQQKVEKVLNKKCYERYFILKKWKFIIYQFAFKWAFWIIPVVWEEKLRFQIGLSDEIYAEFEQNQKVSVW